MYYHDYLKLDQILNSQEPVSRETGREAHEETLFIIAHQVYELWFKQIIHELDSVIDHFKAPEIDDMNLSTVVSRLQRIVEIQRVLVQQIRIVETMTPMDFLDFRDQLYPASGFQSKQFRLLENKLGLKWRSPLNQTPYFDRLNEEHRSEVIQSEKEVCLLELIDKWLCRTPFLDSEEFSFWESYRSSVNEMLAQELKSIEKNETLDGDQKSAQLLTIRNSQRNFASLFDELAYNQLIEKGERRLSNRATQAALLISLYRENPALHLPYQLLTALVDIDEYFASWRHSHALLASRIIGIKTGTGGSAGYEYLKRTSSLHRVFSDLSQLSTYLIPNSKKPKLPESLSERLGYSYRHL